MSWPEPGCAIEWDAKLVMADADCAVCGHALAVHLFNSSGPPTWCLSCGLLQTIDGKLADLARAYSNAGQSALWARAVAEAEKLGQHEDRP